MHYVDCPYHKLSWQGVICTLVLVCVVASAAVCEQQGYSDIASWLASEKKATGRLPGYTAMSERMRVASDSLSPQDIRKLWEDWRASQTSSITVDELSEIARARRAAVDSARIVFSVVEEAPAEEGAFRVISRRRETFVMNRDKLKTDRLIAMKDENFSDANHYVTSYDGEFERRFDGGEGQVWYLKSRQRYFNPYGPVAMQMLLDAEHDLNVAGWRDFDLAAYFDAPEAVRILETREDINGREALVCVSGSTPQHIVWLDAERDFAVLKTQRNRVNWTDEELPIGLRPSSIVECSGFVDCGNGIWMPRKTVIKMFSREDPGKLERRIVTEVANVEMNVPIDDAEFTDIFPPGTKVRDAVAGETYYTGTIADAERDLTETLEGLELDIPLPAAEEPEAEPAGETRDAAEAATPEPPLAQAPPRGRLLAALVVAVAFVLVAALVIIALRRRSPQA